MRSTGGRPVKLNINFCQLVSCFEPLIKSTPEMSESSRMPKVLSNTVTLASQLWSTYNRDVLMNLNKEIHHHRLQDVPVVIPTPFLV